MKVSIITVCYNSAKTIIDTIESVKQQTYTNIEYIIIDGASTDSTDEIVAQYTDTINTYISEQDKGLCDAMNKGIHVATGDIIGILNSDDILANKHTIELIVDSIGDADGIYADIGYYDTNFSKKLRHYSSNNFKRTQFAQGMMPAHPSFYVKKYCYAQAGDYNVNYKIAGDFDMLVRIFNLPNTKFIYVPNELVKMRIGGASNASIASHILSYRERLISCKNNNITTFWLLTLYGYLKKSLGFIKKY